MMLLYKIGYKVFFWLKRMRKRAPKWERIARTYEGYFAHYLNQKFVSWLEKHPVKWGLNTKKRNEVYTVSLTSFPARIHYVHIPIETLMRQSFKPDRIVLWLAQSQFPDRKLPRKLEELQDRGLTIRFCDDLRSHKKYFYAFQEYAHDQIILADDDIFYPSDTIAKLVRLHKERPGDIIGISAQIIAPTMASLPSVWPAPDIKKQYLSCDCAQVFTGAGSLFPAGWYPREVFDKEKAMGIAGTADDLWLKAMSLLAEVKTTVVYPQRGFPVAVEIENNETLFSVNGGQGGNVNDEVWSKLLEIYHFSQLDD